MAQARGAHPHQHVMGRERRRLDPLDRERRLRRVQHGRLVLQRHDCRDRLYFALLFFTPASGKIHMAITMKIAVAITAIA